jgi:hypothetical protein
MRATGLHGVGHPTEATVRCNTFEQPGGRVARIL